jgi:outer membrane protein OmpA-like peptidoglycan-associated protein
MSVAEMVRALIGRDPRYSFTPTAPPEPGTGLCAGQAVKGAPRLSVEPGPATKPTAPVAEAVPYNPGAGASLQLSPQFELGSDRINAASNQLLQNMATALKDPALAGGRFAIAGHADVSGNEPMNQRLSCARAIAVRDFLLSNGLAASQITAYGFGSSQLLPGHAPTSPIHRRVEIRRAR